MKVKAKLEISGHVKLTFWVSNTTQSTKNLLWLVFIANKKKHNMSKNMFFKFECFPISINLWKICLYLYRREFRLPVKWHISNYKNDTFAKFKNLKRSQNASILWWLINLQMILMSECNLQKIFVDWGELYIHRHCPSFWN